MKLPRIGAGEVQSLGRYDVGVIAQEEKAKTDFSTTMAQGVTQAIDYSIAMRDHEIAVATANKSMLAAQTLESLASSDYMNINDPSVPSEARREILNDPSFNSLKATVEGDIYNVPVHVAAPHVYKHYENQINKEEENLTSERTKYFYNSYVKDSIDKSLNAVGKNIIASHKRETGNAYEDQAMFFAESGEVDKVIDLADQAKGLEVWDEERHEEVVEKAYAIGRKRLLNRLSTYRERISSAYRAGNQAEFEQLYRDYIAEADEGESFGLFTRDGERDEYNEEMKKLDQLFASEGFRSHVMNSVAEKGLPAGFAAITQGRNDVPEFYTGEEWNDQVVSKVRTELNQLIADSEQIEKAMENNISLDSAFIEMNSYIISSRRVPSDAKSMKMLDNVYNAQAAQWKELGREQYIDNVSRFVIEHKRIPKSLVNQIETSLLTKEDSMFGASIYSRLKKDPVGAVVLDDLSVTSKSFLTQLSRLSDVTEDYDAAWELAHEAIYKAADYADVRDEEYKTYMKAIDDRVDSSMEANSEWDVSWYVLWDEDPEITAMYKSDYRVLEKAAFMSTGNLDDAAEIATQQLHALYGIDDTNGTKRLIKNGPISRYGDYAKPQFEETIKQRYPDLYNEHGIEAFQLEANAAATKRSNGQPAYNVRFRNPKNKAQTYWVNNDETNMPLLWRPDYQQTEEYEEAQKEKALNLSNALYLQTLHDNAFDMFTSELESNDDFVRQSALGGYNMAEERMVSVRNKLLNKEDFMIKSGEKRAGKDIMMLDEKRWNDSLKTLKAAEKHAEASYKKQQEEAKVRQEKETQEQAKKRSRRGRMDAKRKNEGNVL